MKNNYIEPTSQRALKDNLKNSRIMNVSDKDLDIARSLEPSQGDQKENRSQLVGITGNKMTSPKPARKSLSNNIEKPKERSILLNMQGNYDPVLNKNLVPNNNKILDDSILEVFFLFGFI